jgi:phosphatidylethanolamine/phosphatidyl-N-methylethanolamine N-methyltransferase
MPSDLTLFVKQLVLHPKPTSAVVPSSRALARAMAAPLDPGMGRVAEFGPGTGSLTRAILARGIAPQALTLFEMNPVFADHLRGTFPALRVHTAPAQEIVRLAPPGFDAIVSGLPLLSMSEALQRATLTAAFAALRPGGLYVQFTYGPKPPVVEAIRQDLSLTVSTGPRIWTNLPPARVYVYTQPTA